MSTRRLWIVLALASLGACELVVDFDADKEGAPMVTPIPQNDGAVAVIVDASVDPDATLVHPPGHDAATDAALLGDASAVLDGGAEVDAAPDAASADAQIEPDIDAASGADANTPMEAAVIEPADASSDDAAASDAESADSAS